MNRPLLAFAGLIAAGGTAVGVYVAVPGGGEEEVVQQVATATPATSAVIVTPEPTSTPPAGLPPAAVGYRWADVKLRDYGLVDYSVQVPTEWVGLNQGNPEIFAPASHPLVGAYTPRIIVRFTPADVVILYGFQNALPQQGGINCVILPDGELASAVAKWSLYKFTCPEGDTGFCTIDDQTKAVTCVPWEPGSPVTVFDGRAAEMRIGEYVYSIVIFQPSAPADGEAAFQQAISSFTVR